MGYFYIDESIRENGGFIIGALIYSENDLASVVRTCLEKFPSIKEYKSSSLKSNNAEERELRDCLRSILSACKIGLVILPSNHRPRLGNEILLGLQQIIVNCKLQSEHYIYFDQEIKPEFDITKKFSSVFN